MKWIPLILMLFLVIGCSARKVATDNDVMKKTELQKPANQQQVNVASHAPASSTGSTSNTSYEVPEEQNGISIAISLDKEIYVVGDKPKLK